MAITFTTQDLNIDETAGVQPAPIDETNALAALQANTTYNYLLDAAHVAASGDAGEDANFPQVAYDANFLSLLVPAGTTVTDLVFTHPTSGGTLEAFKTDEGFATTLKDVDGRTVYLFLDPANANVLLGRVSTDPTLAPTASSPLAFAIVLDENTATHQSAGGYIVLYEAMQHDLSGSSPDDIIDLTNQLFVSSATTTTTTTTTTSAFDSFVDVPPGNPDYAIIGPTSGAAGTSLLVTGTSPQGNVLTGAIDDSTVNVSSTGLGSGSQSVGKNSTLQIDFINGGAANTTGNETQISYTSHVETVTEAQFSLTQINPTTETIELVVSAHDSDDANVQGGAFRDAAAGDVTITQVQVFDAAGNLIEDSDGTPNSTGPNTVSATINAAGDAVVIGLLLDYTVKVFSTGMDQIRIFNNDGNKNASFDVGEIKFSSTTTTTTTTVGSDNTEVGSHVNIYDDGPSLALGAALGALVVDETLFGADASASTSGLFTLTGGSDTAATSLTLSAVDGASTGLTATGTNTAIVLDVISPTQVNGIDGSNNVIFTVSVTGGNLVLDQKLAIVHPTTNPDESITMLPGLITLNGQAIDKDNDPAAPLSIDVSGKLTFFDDGPSIDQAITGGTVGFVANRTVTDTFTSATGNDLGDGVIIESASSIVGLTQTFNADRTSVLYEDSVGTDVFRLDVTDTSYTFTVLQTQQNTSKALDFGSVKAGGPQEVLNVKTTDGLDTVKFDGLLVTNDSDPSLAVNNPAGTTDRDDLNPDSLGFGVKGGQASQMNNNEGFSAELVGGELTAFSFGMQAIGNVKSVNVTYWTVDDGVLSPATTTTETLLSGQGVKTFNISAPTGADQIFVEFEFVDKNGLADTNAGVRLLNFTETSQTTLPAANMDFTLSNTDFDADKAISNSFHITVDPAIA